MHNLHRVIEFRGLTSDFAPGEQRWAYGDLDCSDVYTGINEGRSASTPVLEETVGQYVGIQYTLIGNIFEHVKLKDEYARFYWGLTK